MPCFFLPAVAVQAEDTFKVNAKAAFAVDAQSGKILYDQDGENHGDRFNHKIIGLYIVLDQVKKENYHGMIKFRFQIMQKI